MKRIFSLFVTVFLIVAVTISPTSVFASSDGVVHKKCLAVCGPSNSSEQWRENNVIGVKNTFQHLSISSGYYLNNTATNNAARQYINSFFSSADDDDINYLYFAGHGNANAINITDTTEGLYYSTIKTWLDSIPGHFVIFIQGCKSGGAIDGDRLGSERCMEETIIENFFENSSSQGKGALDGYKKYTVYCSCTKTEDSTHSNGYSRATSAWCRGLGYNITTGVSCAKFADTNSNNDGVVTAKELRDYATSFVTSSTSSETPCAYYYYFFETIYSLDYSLGDVNESGIIENADVLLIRQYLTNLSTLNSRQKKLADVDGDGAITLQDSLCLQKYIAGLPL